MSTTDGRDTAGRRRCAIPTLESISDLPLEERHKIVLSWLDTVTTFYERAASVRDAALKACKAIPHAEQCHYDHHGLCQTHGLQPKGECYAELARAALAQAGVSDD